MRKPANSTLLAEENTALVLDGFESFCSKGVLSLSDIVCFSTDSLGRFGVIGLSTAGTRCALHMSFDVACLVNVIYQLHRLIVQRLPSVIPVRLS